MLATRTRNKFLYNPLKQKKKLHNSKETKLSFQRGDIEDKYMKDWNTLFWGKERDRERGEREREREREKECITGWDHFGK
jgi:hypothetical protein